MQASIPQRIYAFEGKQEGVYGRGREGGKRRKKTCKYFKISTIFTEFIKNSSVFNGLATFNHSGKIHNVLQLN